MDDLLNIKAQFEQMVKDGRLDENFAAVFIGMCDRLMERLQSEKAELAALRAELERKDKVARRACQVFAMYACAYECDEKLTIPEAAARYDKIEQDFHDMNAMVQIDAALAFAAAEIPAAVPGESDCERRGRSDGEQIAATLSSLRRDRIKAEVALMDVAQGVELPADSDLARVTFPAGNAETQALGWVIAPSFLERVLLETEKSEFPVTSADVSHESTESILLAYKRLADAGALEAVRP